MRLNTLAPSLLALVIGGLSGTALAEEGCTDFKWDVGKERALFANKADSLAAAADLQSAPLVVPNRLYQLQLLPLDHVTFVTAPAKRYHADGEHGGLVVLKLPAGGSYRVALDMPVWVDVVADARLVPAKDFQGQHDCAAPHKIVEFDLAADQALVLQLSGSTSESVRLSITASPPRKF